MRAVGGEQTAQGGEHVVGAIHDHRGRKAEACVAEGGERRVALAIARLLRPVGVELLAVALEDLPPVELQVVAADAIEPHLLGDLATE